MKKLFYASLMVVMVGLSQKSNAQITLEHTFEGQVTYFGSGGLIGNNTGLNLYGFVNTTTNQVKIYNEDYSLYKTVTITPPTGYSISTGVSCLSKNLFNSNNKVEFILTFTNPNALQQGGNNNLYYSCKMYDEDGVLIKDFGTSYQISPWNIIKKSNKGFNLLILKYIYDINSPSGTTNTTDVYSLPGTIPTDTVPTGTIPTSISKQNTSQLQRPYPNPAKLIITLPYQLKQGETSVMRIYNIQGQLIVQKQIDYVFDKILLNVSSYAKGIYFYEVNGVSNRFIVE
jgi:hypothetical protein